MKTWCFYITNELKSLAENKICLGTRRNPVNWTQNDARTLWIVNRGYTGHEHMDAFSIINMNGRVYDPLTAMFFSPDPFTQSAGDWKNYNRYSYCLNNPTRYIDPSGYKQANLEMPVFSDLYYAINGISGGFSGGSGGGSAFRLWDAQHRGTITYNWENEKYEYANGDEATTDAAIEQLYDRTRPEDRQTYSGSTLGYDHLYTLTFSDGSIRLAGSIGGEITEVANGKFNVTNNGYGAVLAANGEVTAWGKSGNSLLEDINTGLGVFGTIIGAETFSMDFLIRNNYKSATSWSGFAKLRPSQQNWRTIDTLGKTGAKALKYAKNLGYLGAAAGVGIATYQMIDNPTIGNATRLAVQGTAIGVAFIPVVGWGISIGIGAADLIWGD